LSLQIRKQFFQWIPNSGSFGEQETGYKNASKNLYERIHINAYKLEIDKIDEIFKYLK
jgi:hypothetical protein